MPKREPTEAGPGGGAACAVTLGSWDECRDAASRIRFEVFVAEQRVPPELEIDELDPQCLHALAWDAHGHALGTGRLLPDGHIGRMAVLREARARGVGSALLLSLMQAARSRGHRRAELYSQVHAQGFYARHGFTPVGDIFEEAGIEHIRMRATLFDAGDAE